MRGLCSVILPGLAVLACVGGILALFARPSRAPVATPGGSSPAIDVGPAADAAMSGDRRQLTTRDAPTITPVASVSFDAIVDQLVTLGSVVMRAVRAESQPIEAEHANDRAEELLRDLRLRFPEPETFALDRLTRLGDDATHTDAQVRRGVLLRIIRDGLVALHERSSASGSRRPLDAFVSALLATLPRSPGIADALAPLLTDAPYLGEAHEGTVLGLAEQAGVDRFLQPVAAALLRTLWHNLRANGARSDAEIAALALLLQDDLNATRRLAALQELLVASGGRYRELAIARVRDSGDETMAQKLGQIAASELPPDEAIDALSALQSIAVDGLLGAFLTVGERDGAALERRYERCLEEGSGPELRAALVSGAMTSDSAAGLALAQSAFDHDPDRRVRIRALYALAAHPNGAVAEAALSRALDDPLTAGDAEWVRNVAGALRNLAAGAGSGSALRRIGQRLLEHPLLDEPDRQRVLALLQRSANEGPR